MKKLAKVLAVFAVAFLITGCGDKKEVLKKCSLTKTDKTNGYTLESEYEVHGKGDIVEKVVTTETVKSDNDEILDYLETYIKETYSTMDEEYGGYDFEVKKSDGKLVSKTTIDYKELDIAQYVKDNSELKKYVNDKNELLLDGIIKIYEAMGAECK